MPENEAGEHEAPVSEMPENEASTSEARFSDAPENAAPDNAAPDNAAPEGDEPDPAEATGDEPEANAAEYVAPALPTVPDDVLLASVDLAREALLETTPASTVGGPAGYQIEGEHVLSLRFECTLPGYPGWYWTVTLSRIDQDSAPSVLETELMPGDGALLAPDWLPWSERLAEYQASQEALHASEAAGADDDDDDDDTDDDAADFDDDDDSDDDDDDDDTDDDDDDDDDDDTVEVHNLHAGDIDGVDIDSVDASYDEETDDDADLDLPVEEAAALEDAAPDDFEPELGSASFDGEVAESDESEGESDDDRPEPPAVS